MELKKGLSDFLKVACRLENKEWLDGDDWISNEIQKQYQRVKILTITFHRLWEN